MQKSLILKKIILNFYMIYISFKQLDFHYSSAYTVKSGQTKVKHIIDLQTKIKLEI